MNQYDLSGLLMTYSMYFGKCKTKKQLLNLVKRLEEELKNMKIKDIY